MCHYLNFYALTGIHLPFKSIKPLPHRFGNLFVYKTVDAAFVIRYDGRVLLSFDTPSAIPFQGSRHMREMAARHVVPDVPTHQCAICEKVFHI